jgi:exopolysaccharide biosynthesis WecB/TagA/CpsF family protein
VIDQGKQNVLGIRIDAVDYEAAVGRIIQAAWESRPLAVSALAVHGLMTAVLDPVHRWRLNDFEMLVPDGQPVRWALRWLHGTRLPDRVYGPKLMLDLCAQAEEQQLPLFLFGGTAELLSTLSNNLQARFPRLPIAGTCPSKFRRLSAGERDSLVDAIRQSGARITFVGLGCPRQEVWAFEFRRALSMPVVAVGAAFNFHAGLLAQAPRAMQDRGLEWLFRLACEPRRLWRRYLLLNPLYLCCLLVQKCRLRRFDPHNALPPTEEVLYG